MTIAIIPARAGSKRVPKKNIKDFLGRPMIAYAIGTAQKSGVFDRILVSTDSDEIAQIAEKAGAEAPFRRPSELANDHATTKAVLDHALAWLKKNGAAPDCFCCLYPTSPLLSAESLREAHELLLAKKAPALYSVTEFETSIHRALKIAPGGHLEMVWPENELKRSNDLPAAFRDAGQFYWFRLKNYEKAQKIWEIPALPYILPRHLAQDIDTPEDWILAEKLYQAFRMPKL